VNWVSDLMSCWDDARFPVKLVAFPLVYLVGACFAIGLAALALAAFFAPAYGLSVLGVNEFASLVLGVGFSLIVCWAIGTVRGPR
jgi:hypothetical protein